MAWMHPDAVEYQRKRWMRPDAHRWLRPDAERWLSPEERRLLFPEQFDRKNQEPSAHTSDSVDDGLDDSARLRLISIIRAAQFELALIKHELALRRKAYNPNQPRVPAGSTEGGQWTSEDGANHTRVAQLGGMVTDANGKPYYRPGGIMKCPSACTRSGTFVWKREEYLISQAP